jgi:hypothetical protein
MGDRHLESQGFDHGLVAVQKAEEGDFSGAEAHLRDGGTALLRVADRGETGLDPGTVHGLRWSWGQRVTDQAIDANNPGLAVEVMDRLSTDLGPPPPAQRPSHELARFAATLQSGEELSPREVLESARTISEGFRDQRQYRARATPHWLAASHLIAEGKTVEAGLALQAARGHVSFTRYPLDARGVQSDVQSWLEHAALPTEHTPGQMHGALRRLDAAGAAPEARQLATSLDRGELSPPRISMDLVRQQWRDDRGYREDIPYFQVMSWLSRVP